MTAAVTMPTGYELQDAAGNVIGKHEHIDDALEALRDGGDRVVRCRDGVLMAHRAKWTRREM